MRFIDADEFISYMESKCDYTAELDPIILAVFRGAIKEQPTAYDIGKVVKYLEDELKTAESTYRNYNMKVDLGRIFGLERAIEIVKAGVKSHENCDKN